MTFWDEQTFVSYDTETTGVDFSKDRVVEFGFSIWRGGEEISSWGELVNPSIPIDPGATKVHGITNNDVKDSPTFDKFADNIIMLLSMGVTVAYNAPYDVQMITAELERCGKKFPNVPVLDPMVWFKKFEKYNRGKKLTDAAKRYGFSHVGAHRAYEDAEVSMKVLYHMHKTKTKMPKELDVLLKTQRELAEHQWADMNRYRRSKGLDEFERPKFEVYEMGM